MGVVLENGNKLATEVSMFPATDDSKNAPCNSAETACPLVIFLHHGTASFHILPMPA